MSPEWKILMECMSSKYLWRGMKMAGEGSGVWFAVATQPHWCTLVKKIG